MAMYVCMSGTTVLIWHFPVVSEYFTLSLLYYYYFCLQEAREV